MPEKRGNKPYPTGRTNFIVLPVKDLEQVLNGPLSGAFGGVHILPFFPSSGDRGFAPITYREVDPVFGTWDDIDRIGSRYYLMFDYMINHISVRSPEYQDFLETQLIK